MERGKHTMIWVNRLGTGNSEMEGVGDRRVVHRAAVGRGGGRTAPAGRAEQQRRRKPGSLDSWGLVFRVSSWSYTF